MYSEFNLRMCVGCRKLMFVAPLHHVQRETLDEVVVEVMVVVAEVGAESHSPCFLPKEEIKSSVSM